MKATLLRIIIPFIAIVHNLYAYRKNWEEWERESDEG